MMIQPYSGGVYPRLYTAASPKFGVQLKNTVISGNNIHLVTTSEGSTVKLTEGSSGRMRIDDVEFQFKVKQEQTTLTCRKTTVKWVFLIFPLKQMEEVKYTNGIRTSGDGPDTYDEYRTLHNGRPPAISAPGWPRSKE